MFECNEMFFEQKKIIYNKSDVQIPEEKNVQGTSDFGADIFDELHGSNIFVQFGRAK